MNYDTKNVLNMIQCVMDTTRMGGPTKEVAEEMHEEALELRRVLDIYIERLEEIKGRDEPKIIQ